MPAQKELDAVRFELREEDLAAFQAGVIERSPQFRRQWWIGLLALPMIIAAGFWLYVRSAEDPAAAAEKLWWLLLLIPIHCALHPRRWRQNVAQLRERIARDMKKNKLLGKRRVLLTAEEIREVNPLQEVSAPWPKVLKVERVEERLYVYLSPIAAIIVPQKAFEKPEEFEAFAEKAEGYFSAARVSK